MVALPFAFHSPPITSVAPPLVLNELVPPPTGLPAKLILPPPLPPVKLNAVLFQNPVPAVFNEKVDALLILTLAGPTLA